MSALCRRCNTKPARSRGLCPCCYENERRRMGWQSSYIDAEPVRAHIQALRDAGIGNKRLRLLSGVSHNTIQVIMTGRPERGSGPTKKVWRRTAEKLLAVPVPEIPHAAVAGGAKVSAVGTHRRLQALVAFGYSRSYICSRLGIHISNGCRLFQDDHRAVNAATARRVEELFRELQMTPGSGSRARNEGRLRGWPLPMDWDEDDIDNPCAQAVRSETTRSRRAENDEDVVARIEQVAAWTRLGMSASQIAERLNISARQVVRYRAGQREISA